MTYENVILFDFPNVFHIIVVICSIYVVVSVFLLFWQMQIRML
jgi:hypothetical protein